MSLNRKFIIYTIITLILLSIILGFISYFEVRKTAEEEAYRITERLVAEVEATRSYVREVLRPTSLNLIPQGSFIPELMSGSFVARNVFERFLKQYPDYHVKFASLNPRNPINQADKIEVSILNHFQSEIEPNNQWQGIVTRNGQDYFTVARSLRFKKACLKCHGDPVDAPTSLLAEYGPVNGFGVNVGDVTMYSVGVPVRVTYGDIWTRGFSKFWPAMLILVSFFVFVVFIFKQQVGDPIKILIQSVEGFAKGNYASRAAVDKVGKLIDLALSFNEMAQKLSDNIHRREKVEKDLLVQQNTLERQVEKRTEELSITNRRLEDKIFEHEKAEELIKFNLKEKETLLQEIHHRVKNNMNVVSSLLKLHGQSSNNNDVKMALEESQGRVYAMSAVHEALYNSRNLAEIDLVAYLSKLSTSLIQTFSVNHGKIQFKIGGDKVNVNIEKASPLGLVVNELISNSLKYAFPGGQPGVIEVATTKQSNQLKLTIKDNGQGLPEGFDWKNSKSLGLKLVRNLVENQLNGSVDVKSIKGTQFTINISLEY